MAIEDNAVLAVGLEKRFGATKALDGFDLFIPYRMVYGLLGPNGAGKTTAVRILSTLIQPTAGHAEVAGFDVVREPMQVRRRIGLAGQYAAVDEILTGRQNLEMFGRLFHLGAKRAKQRAIELLAQFDLTDAGDKGVKQYSGGMRRRLDLAASLILAPQVLFLDEPTAGLDPRSRNEVWDAVRRLVAQGTTVLLTTQYLEEADQLAGRISVIDHGRVIADGSPYELKARVGSETVELFFDDVDALGEAAVVLDGAPVDLERLSVRVATDGSAASVRELLDRIDGVARIDIHRPTLDDAFFTLTERIPA